MALEFEMNMIDQVPESTVCEVHGRPFTRVYTHDNTFLCPTCCESEAHREHMTKSISFLAEEISEQLRVKLVPHERQLEGFAMLLKDITDKFKRCNLRQQLSQVLDLIRVITKGFEKS